MLGAAVPKHHAITVTSQRTWGGEAAHRAQAVGKGRKAVLGRGLWGAQGERGRKVCDKHSCISEKLVVRCGGSEGINAMFDPSIQSIYAVSSKHISRLALQLSRPLARKHLSNFSPCFVTLSV